jgi:hypothetical protein
MDDTARQAGLINVRFPPIGGNQEIRECQAHYAEGGAWAVVENGRVVGTALDPLEWRPLSD